MAIRPNSAHSVSAGTLRGLLAHARAAKIPTAGLLEAAGLSSAQLEGAEARVPEVASNLVWANLAAAAHDPDLGLHVAERLTLDGFDVVGYLLTQSRTFGEGLERLCAYSRILHDAGRVEVERRGPRLVVFPGCRGLIHEFPRHIAEHAAAAVLVLGRLTTRRDLRATAVRFRHPAPAQVGEHLRIFGVAPTFDAPETEVELDGSVRELPIAAATPGVPVTYLEAYARDVQASLPSDTTLVGQIEQLVATSLARGVFDLDSVAALLGHSARSLQRRLAELEVSFQVIVDGVRRRFAERYLAEDRLPINEVAFLLGFADPPTFQRAFRRWTGVTPPVFRAARLAA